MIPKKGKDPTVVNSYRPISLLPILSKVFERTLLNKLQPCLDEIIPNHQFGFRRGHSTTQQVHRATWTVKKALDERKYCSAVFLDVSQAFDRVWHNGLKYKIKHNINQKISQSRRSTRQRSRPVALPTLYSGYSNVNKHKNLLFCG